MNNELLTTLIVDVEPYFYTVNVVAVRIHLKNMESRILTICDTETCIEIIVQCVGQTVSHMKQTIERLGLEFLAELSL